MSHWFSERAKSKLEEAEMSKHTPGPWRAVICYPGSYIDVPHIESKDLSPEETNANLRLMACAPEMLTMLKHVINYLGPNSYGLRTEIEALIQRAQSSE